MHVIGTELNGYYIIIDNQIEVKQSGNWHVDLKVIMIMTPTDQFSFLISAFGALACLQFNSIKILKNTKSKFVTISLFLNNVFYILND